MGAPIVRGTTRRTLLISARSSAVRFLGTYALSIASLPFVLRQVGVDAYGAWATASTVLALAGVADLGVRTEIVRRVAEAHGARDHERVRQELRRGVCVMLAFAVGVGSVLSVVAATFVPKLFRGEAEDLRQAALVLFLGAIALLLAGLVSGAYFSALTALQRNDFANYGLLLGTVAGVAATVAFATVGLGAYALLLGAVVQWVIATCVQALGMRRLALNVGWPLRWQNLRGATTLFGLSAMVVLTQVSDVVDHQLDKIYLARIVGAAASAEYQIGTSVVIQLRALALIPLALMLVAVAELGGQPERMRRAYLALAPPAVAAGALLMSLAFLFAPAFFALLLGPDFVRSGTAASLYSIAMLINIVSAPWALFAIGRGLAHLAACSAVVNAVVNGVASLVLTLAIGFDGALFGSIAGNGAGVLVLYVLIRHRADLPWLGGVARTSFVLAPAVLLTYWLLLGVDLTWVGLVAAAGGYTALSLLALHFSRAIDLPALMRLGAGRA